MVVLVNTNMCVARHVMLMMLLQLPWFWSWVAAAAAAAAVVVVVVVVLLQLGVGFKLLLSNGPGSPEVLPCSTWATCGVLGEHTHVWHSVAGSGWAVFVVLLLFLGR